MEFSSLACLIAVPRGTSEEGTAELRRAASCEDGGAADGDQDDGSRDHIAPEWVHVEEHEPAVDGGNDERPDEAARNRPGATRHSGAADDCGRDHLELKPCTYTGVG